MKKSLKKPFIMTELFISCTLSFACASAALLFSRIFITVNYFTITAARGSIENGVCPPRKMMWFLPNIAQGGNRGPRKAQAQKAPRRGGDSPPAHNPSVSFADSSPYTGEPCVFAEMTLFRRASVSPKSGKLNKLRVGAAIRRPPTTPQSASLTAPLTQGSLVFSPK